MARDFLVGILFLASLALLIFIAITIKGVSWSDHFVLKVDFDNISGLDKGDNVRYRGMKVGTVGEPKFAGDHIRVELLLDQELPARVGYEIQVMPSSALGGSFVDYVPGGGTLIPADTALRGTGGNDLLSRAGRFLQENDDTIRQVIANLERISGDIAEAKGLLGQVIVDPEYAAKFADIVESVRSFTQKIDRGENLVGTLLNNPELAEHARSLGRTLDDIASKANSGTGPLSALLNDTELATSIKSMASDLQDVAARLRTGEGIAGRIIGDSEMADEIEVTLKKLYEIVDNVREGPSVVHTLLFDEQVDHQVREATTSLAQAAEQLSGPHGTIGKLLYEDDLYRDLRQITVLAREGLEDYREQAPINSFINILFSAL